VKAHAMVHAQGCGMPLQVAAQAVFTHQIELHVD
jgi:hypothetical protein